MKKNQIKILLVFVLLFSLTGCTKYVKNEDNKVVKNEKTGQNLTENILSTKQTDTKCLSLVFFLNLESPSSAEKHFFIGTPNDIVLMMVVY